MENQKNFFAAQKNQKILNFEINLVVIFNPLSPKNLSKF